MNRQSATVAAAGLVAACGLGLGLGLATLALALTPAQAVQPTEQPAAAQASPADDWVSVGASTPRETFLVVGNGSPEPLSPATSRDLMTSAGSGGDSYEALVQKNRGSSARQP